MPAWISSTAGRGTRESSLTPLSISRVTLAERFPSSSSTPMTSQTWGQPRCPARIEPVPPKRRSADCEPVNRSAKVTREMESGVNELSRVPLPAVLEIQAGINHPRYASLKGIMAAKKKEIARVTPADLGLDAAQVGAAGSRLEVVSVAFPA